VYRNAVGCYMHGSLLPKNPWLADRLLLAALRRRYGAGVELPALDDRLEDEAHRAVEAAIRGGKRAKSGAW
jgi:CobQ-like glutamine amidotransferase family enzyme